MKKAIALILTLAMSLSLAACSGGGSGSGAASNPPAASGGSSTSGTVSSGVGASVSADVISVDMVSGWVGSAFFFPGTRVRIATTRTTITRIGIRNFNTISTGDGLCFLLRVLPLREDPL